MLRKTILPIVGSLLLSSPAVPQNGEIQGFTPAHSRDQRAREGQFLALPQAENCRKFLRTITEDPRLAGTPEGRKAADYVRSRLLEYGWEAELVEYLVYLPYPRQIEVELLAPESYRASLTEKGWAWDKDSSSPSTVMPFHAYSPSGEVTADLIYVNYGLPRDYKKLADLGIDVSGKIVMARYGKSFRGVKVKTAQEHGAAGLIIYSDPGDDGYARGDVYPRGPWRPESAVQRGSVKFSNHYPGDPLTPGWASIQDARRIAPEHAESMPKIPSVPLSYEDAAPLLRHLSGPNVPRGWQGHLPFAYHIGPGPARVRLKTDIDFKNRPIWNVMAVMPGTDLKEEWVILGNHRDAWVHGAVDPGSGTAVMLELARSLGEMKKQGWQPRRTLVLGSWDAEEFGLIGSTEWVEQHAEELHEKAVAYINLDAAVSGHRFRARAVPELRDFIRGLTRAVEDPKSKTSVFEAWARQTRNRPVPQDIGEMGGGSDFVPFLHHLGIPSMDLGFSGPYGVYHSMLDNYYWMTQFGDPTFAYHEAMTKIAGIAMLRLAHADLLPLRPSEQGRVLSGHFETLGARQGDMPAAFSSARNLAGKYTEKATKLETDCDKAVLATTEARIEGCNQILRRVTKAFLDQEGLRGRIWYRNLLVAPGLYTGYEPVFLPGVQEAMEAEDSERILAELKRLAETMDQASSMMEISAEPFIPTRDPAPTGGQRR